MFILVHFSTLNSLTTIVISSDVSHTHIQIQDLEKAQFNCIYEKKAQFNCIYENLYKSLSPVT